MRADTMAVAFTRAEPNEVRTRVWREPGATGGGARALHYRRRGTSAIAEWSNDRRPRAGFWRSSNPGGSLSGGQVPAQPAM